MLGDSLMCLPDKQILLGSGTRTLHVFTLRILGDVSRLFLLSWGEGPLPRQRAGLRRRHATASWAYLFRLIKLLSSSSYQPLIDQQPLSRGKGRFYSRGDPLPVWHTGRHNPKLGRLFWWLVFESAKK
jgi:hypothetical protein